MTKARKAKTAPVNSVFNMAGIAPVEASSDDALLASMIGDLGIDEDDEIVESEVEPETIEAAVADIEKAEAREALYEEQDAEIEATPEADKPKAVEPKAKKEKKAKEPKAPRVTSLTHKPGDRLIALLGGNKDALVFAKSDDTIAAEKRAEKFIEDMNDREAIADKVKDKAIMLLTWIVSGKDTSALNEVLKRSFEVLFKDGELTSGQKGNLQQNLLSKPYSAGTAASQANQMFMLFPILGITTREKGKMVINPDSTIVEAMKLKLGA